MNIKYTEYYEKEIEAIKRELSELPDGHLTIQGSRYYETNGAIRKGITKDPRKTRQLARKAYLSRRLKHLGWNLSLMEKQSGRYKTEDPIEIIQGLPSFYKLLPTDYFFHASSYDLLKNTFGGSAGHSGELIYLTSSGISVRSKSERIIADTLYRYDIPYQYETPFVMGGKKVYPDFTISKPFDGKMVLWEHFGLLGNVEYRQKAVEKLAHYARNGYFPFDNLICTYERDLQNPARISAIIEVFLLQ